MTLGGASRGAVLALRCPHCGERQARERKNQGASYRCRRCHRCFTREEGVAAEKRR
jgi:transposase-like protein